MQGVFQNVDWRGLLTPGLDEDTQRMAREKKRNDALLDIAATLPADDSDGDVQSMQSGGSSPEPAPVLPAPAPAPAPAPVLPAPTPAPVLPAPAPAPAPEPVMPAPAPEPVLPAPAPEPVLPAPAPAPKTPAPAPETPRRLRPRKQPRTGADPASPDVDPTLPPVGSAEDRPYNQPSLHDGPQPATRTFVLQPGARRFYVIPGRHEARAGRFGHYLRPYTVTTSFETNPFPLPQALVQRGENLDYYPLGVPGVPWPSIEQQGSDWCNRVVADNYYFLDSHACADRQLYRAGDSYKQLSFLGPDGDKDPYFPPDPTYAMNGRDYVRCTGDQAYSEIGRETLMEAVAEGERLDLAFARRMAGLLGVNMDAVWDCLDPGFNPADRQDVLSQFLGSYTKDFYGSVSFKEDTDARAVIIEALQQHKTFCQEWVHKHYRCLTPLVTSAAEALVAEFQGALQPYTQREYCPAVYRLTLEQFARLMMRDAELAPTFANALYTYMSNLDITRPNRNPTYKQMSTVSNTAIRTHYRMMEELSNRRTRVEDQCKRLATAHAYYFDPLVVDWHGIAGQLPDTHVHFQRGAENLAMRFRNVQPDTAPWMQYRDTT